jgi:hypothetical protein
VKIRRGGVRVKDLKELLPYYNLNTRCIYYDKKFDKGGIDYEKFIVLKDDVEKYTPNEFYILWYLVSKSSISRNYLKTNIALIMEETNLNIFQVKESLSELTKKKVVYLSCDINSLKRNDFFEIVIGYNLDECYDVESEKYKIIPVDIANIVLPTITPNEWYLYCILSLYYNFQDKYAYPSIEQISKKYDMSNGTIVKSISVLTENKYNLVSVEKINYNNGKFPNNRYHIRLFQRHEYAAYYLSKKEKEFSDRYHSQSVEKYQSNKKNYVFKN